MAPLSPSSPLHSHLESSLSLLSPGMHGQLQDEDLTLTLGDDSFDQYSGDDQTERLQQPVFGSSSNASASGGAGAQSKSKADVAFGGSMGVLSPASLPSPLPPVAGPSSTPSARRAREQEEDADLDADYELLEGGEGGEGSGITEEERKRIVQLREERDGLRGMNRTLEGLLNGLKGMEGKLQALDSNVSTSHQLLDLYSRIASQAEHTQNLLLDTQWHGVTADAQLLLQREAEAEAEAARLAAEEAERVERERQEAEQAERERIERETRERAKAEAPKRGAPRGRARGTTSTRGSIPSTRGGSSSFSTTSSSSFTSGIGRGGPPSSSTTGGGAGRGTGTVTGVRGVRGLRSRVLVRGAGTSGRGRGGGD